MANRLRETINDAETIGVTNFLNKKVQYARLLTPMVPDSAGWSFESVFGWKKERYPMETH
jgi:hypothetical protein